MKRRAKTTVIANVRVGKRDVAPWTPSHVRGVYQGNKHHPTQRPKGLEEEEAQYATATARRSTGIRARSHDVIDPRMPKLSPS